MLLAAKFLANFIPVVIGMVALLRQRSRLPAKRDKLAYLGIAPFAPTELFYGLMLPLIAFTVVFIAFPVMGLAEVTGMGWPGYELFPITLMFITVAIGEEFVFRGLFFRGLAWLGLSTGLILILSAAFFAVGHIMNDGVTALSTLSAFIGGLMYGYAFIKTGRLWLPIGIHLAWNWVQGALYGFPVSGEVVDSFVQISISGPTWLTGGAYGPEGSVLGIGARLLVILGIFIMPLSRPANPLPVSRSSSQA